MNTGRPLKLNNIDGIDAEILLSIKTGHTNSYSIWKNLGEDTMTYKNANMRVVSLREKGIIEEVEYEGRTPHGRIDYRISKNGKEVIRQHIHKLEQILSS